MSPEDLAELLREEGSGSSEDYDEDQLPPIRQNKTEFLAPVLALCKGLWESQSLDLDFFAEKLGDGSRDGE